MDCCSSSWYARALCYFLSAALTMVRFILFNMLVVPASMFTVVHGRRCMAGWPMRRAGGASCGCGKGCGQVRPGLQEAESLAEHGRAPAWEVSRCLHSGLKTLVAAMEATFGCARTACSLSPCLPCCITFQFSNSKCASKSQLAQCQPAGHRTSLCPPRRMCSWYARSPLLVRVQTLLPRLGLCAGVLSLTVY